MRELLDVPRTMQHERCLHRPGAKWWCIEIFRASLVAMMKLIWKDNVGFARHNTGQVSDPRCPLLIFTSTQGKLIKSSSVQKRIRQYVQGTLFSDRQGGSTLP